jgi:hypothetical protein
VLFSEDFGTSFQDIYSGSNWECKYSSASSYNTSSAPCGGTGERAYGLSGFNYYITTKQITLGASGNQLSFDYSFDYSISKPQVLISTSATCGSAGTDITGGGLAQTATCDNISFNLDAYANQTIRIVFIAKTSSKAFYIDNVIVSTGNGGGGGDTTTDVKWADTFNDGDTDLDFTGNDGDEDCSGSSWTLVDGASIASSGSYTVNRNDTEAFNTTTDDNSGYGVLLDKNESLESPTVDLSSQESFKVSFYAMKQGGTANWNSWTKLYLEYWDGSSWQTLQEIKNSATATSSENDYFIESGFGYHCFTVYKSNTSPGNYYYRFSPHVNPDCFHSDFKLRWRLDEFMSSDYPQVYIDNITFRADDDGQLVIPCGLSYWNAPEATGYGLDPEASLTNNAPRGVEVETDDLFSGMKGTPDWTGHFNDGNTGGNDLYEIMWAVVSEQKISTTYAKVNFMYPDGSSPQNKTMNLDDAYSGPGYLYYYKEFADCDGSSPGSFNTGPGIIYHFYFQYGSDFRPVYTHLNSSGIEMGGGATDLTEGMNPEICTSVLPVEIIDLNAEVINNKHILSWQTASETNNDYFIVQCSENGKDFIDIAIVDGAGNSNTIQSYQFETEQNLPLTYYRLKQVDFDGTQNFSKKIAVQNQKNSFEIFINHSDNNTIYITSQQEYKNTLLLIIDVSGKIVLSQKHHLFSGENKIMLNNIEKGLYIVSLIDENSQFQKQKRLVIP